MSFSLSDLNIDEVLRYMGVPPEKADPATRTLARECGIQLIQEVRPRWTYRVCSLAPEANGIRLDNKLLLPGQDIKQHLYGCSQAVLFALTLSAGADGLIRRTEPVDMAQAYALDCCATAAVEHLCDQAEKQLQAMFPGCFFPFRYSPGYGDLPLDIQSDLLDLLDAPRRIGLTCSSTSILIPRKSVTAILGISEHPVPQTIRSCVACPVFDSCQYRKSGGHCGIS